MRAAIAAGDLTEAEEWASELAHDLLDDNPLVRKAASLALRGVDIDGLVAARVLRALDQTNLYAMYLDVESVGLRVRTCEQTEREAFWLGVLKQLKAGVLKDLVATPRIVSPAVRLAAGEILAGYYHVRLTGKDYEYLVGKSFRAKSAPVRQARTKAKRVDGKLTAQHPRRRRKPARPSKAR